MLAGKQHETPSQFLIIVLNTSKFAGFFLRHRRVFQIFGLQTLRLFAPKVTWFHLGISRLSLYFISRKSLRHFYFQYTSFYLNISHSTSCNKSLKCTINAGAFMSRTILRWMVWEEVQLRSKIYVLEGASIFEFLISKGLN